MKGNTVMIFITFTLIGLAYALGLSCNEANKTIARIKTEVSRLKEKNRKLDKYNNELEEILLSRRFMSTPEANTSE